jgi:hypothetical protein
VHWRAVERGLHLGYRKGANGGTWVARYRRDDGRYATKALGKADDRPPSTGAANGQGGADSELLGIDHSEALRRARDWFEARMRAESGEVEDTPYTVDEALDADLAWFESHRKSYADVKRRADTFIRPALGENEVRKLTPGEIRRWHQDIAKSPARVHTGRGQPDCVAVSRTTRPTAPQCADTTPNSATGSVATLPRQTIPPRP